MEAGADIPPTEDARQVTVAAVQAMAGDGHRAWVAGTRRRAAMAGDRRTAADRMAEAEATAAGTDNNFPAHAEDGAAPKRCLSSQVGRINFASPFFLSSVFAFGSSSKKYQMME